MTIQTNKILIAKSDAGSFAFTKDETNNLVYQEIGNLSDDWNIVDMMGLDDEYKILVEEAIKQLNKHQPHTTIGMMHDFHGYRLGIDSTGVTLNDHFQFSTDRYCHPCSQNHKNTTI